MTVTVLNLPKSDNTMADIADNVSDNVRVIVRVRPPNDVEKNTQGKNVVEIMNENILIFDPKEEPSPCLGRSRKRRHRDIRKRRQKDLKFAFDRVFGWTSSNDEIFEQTTKTVLDGLLGGYNSSVFAYGATGAGKTHTMLGTESHPGVIYHTMIYLYKQIGLMSKEKTCDVAVSYLEVYNEQIRDLLLPRGTLPIREDPSMGVLVPGLSLHKPSNAEELLYMLQFGNKNRTQHPTDANAESSRSHAVFQVFVRQRDRTANISAEVKVAKMCLVDLAGSERANVTRNRGARFREGANINRSLLALGNVINALADHKYKGHIPYRDSKLTRLLKDSLGGNCRTIMIAAVSPSSLSYEDTYNTLKYADRAKNIRLSMKKNVLSVDFHISQYGRIVEELRREITELKSKLQNCEGPRDILSLSLPADLQNLRGSLQAAYNDRRALRDQQLQQETSVRDIQWRLHCKQKCLHRASQLTHTQPETLQKIQGIIQGLQKKLMGQEVQRQTLSQQLQDNTHHLQGLHSRLAAVDDKSSLISQVLEVSVQKLALEVELNDAQHYVHHLRRLARAQERESVTSETLITVLLHLVQRQHAELQSRGSIASDIATGYQRVCELVGQWGVSWADSEGKGKGDQEPFHINSIINIPLVTSAAVAVDRIPLPGKPTGVACSNEIGLASKLNPAISCPGRVINGQVVFSTTPSSVSTTQPVSVQLTAAHVSGGSCIHPQEAWEENENAVPTESMNSSKNNHYSFAGVDSFHKAKATTIYAGHTPNPKKLGQNLETKPGQMVFSTIPATTATPQPAFGQAEAEIACNIEKNPFVSAASVNACVSVPHAGMPHKLNETFSCEDLAELATDSASNKVNLSTALNQNGPTLLTVPVIDPCLSPSAKKLFESSACVSEALCVPAAPPDSCALQPELQVTSNGMQPTQHSSVRPLVSVSHELETQGGNGAFCSSGTRHTDHAQDTQAGVPADTGVAGEIGADRRTRGKWDKENDGPRQRQGGHVKRAINFDGAAASPLRVEGRSYADAVKTPTPPRQPLQALDNNSPQFQSRTVPTAPNQTPKSTGRASLYLAGPQAMDNMRRLKQLGMPSLVENLITGCNNGGPVCEGSKPSYMKPTKATAQRVRYQPPARDDNFNPKRVQHRHLAHSRSKSTSALTKTGWKI